jgi:predicted nucleic acid-binding protein
MNARYLLDTSAASYAITKKSLAFDHHLAKVPMAEIGVSTVTEAELRYGLAKRPSPALQATIATFLLAVTVFPGIRKQHTITASFALDLNAWGNFWAAWT